MVGKLAVGGFISNAVTCSPSRCAGWYGDGKEFSIPKGAKTGAYKVKVKVAAAGDAAYQAGSRIVTVKIVVK